MTAFLTALRDDRGMVTPAPRRRDTSVLTDAPNGRGVCGRGRILTWTDSKKL